MSGLQRRRVNNAQSADETWGSERQTPAPAKSDEDGPKIGYDPKDIQTAEEEDKQPRLTLMEEVLLMGLKDQQGYLSFWNDNISYALRGCIIMELALRGKVQMVNDTNRRRFPISDRYIEVIDDKLTGEALLDETVKIMKASEKLTVGTWINYLSGETWNLSKISYQLKQVRERLSKGLVDKGILRTEKRNFFLFDMPTHPVADTGAKEDIKKRVLALLTARTVVINPSPYLPEGVPYRYLRSVGAVCGAYAANVLENVLADLSYEMRDQAFARADDLLNDFSEWPFVEKPGQTQNVGVNLFQEINDEIAANPDKELQLEVVAGVFDIFANLDSIL
ncbi:Vacuolar protein sorting-associated protein 74 [Yarrowia sp. B02]|nr:Vacuolar protein sorting-associated protein 74 [Yarrowia sp. B02]